MMRVTLLFSLTISLDCLGCFPKRKFEAFDKLKVFTTKVENESGLRIKCLWSDKGEEFTSNQFNAYCEDHGIRRQNFNT